MDKQRTTQNRLGAVVALLTLCLAANVTPCLALVAKSTKISSFASLQQRTTSRSSRASVSRPLSMMSGVDSDSSSPNGALNIEGLSSVATIRSPPSPSALPELSSKGLYQIKSEEQYRNFINSHPDKLVIIKFFATYCKACRALEPKFLAVKEDKQLDGLPIVWGEYAFTKDNKDFFQELSVLALPSVHFYDGSRAALVENFPCGPGKIRILKKKLARFVNSRVDPDTYRLMPAVVPDQPIPQKPTKQQQQQQARETIPTEAPAEEEEQPAGEQEPRVTRRIVDNELITAEHFDFLRNKLPFFSDMPEEDFDTMLNKAKLLTFDAGDIIIRQGLPGTTFFVVKSGVAEMSVRSRKYDDPSSSAASDYLGVVVNELKKFDYFGERALTTGEPYAASVRVLDKVRCFAFNVEDIPESCILSRERQATDDFINYLDQRYAFQPLQKQSEQQQQQQSDENELQEGKDAWAPVGPMTTPGDAQAWSISAATSSAAPYPVAREEESVLELLIHFRRIRQASNFFAYIIQSEPRWGDKGEIARRTMLVRKLPKYQKQEFMQVFDMVDTFGRNRITLLGMRQFMESARHKSNEEVLREINSNPLYRGAMDHIRISREEFLGVMAEAEFFNLFKETFQELDHDSTGYVRAADLDDVLGSVRDLVSVDYSADRYTSTIIDVEDKDMLVDYEQFSRMLLGAAL